MDAVAALPADGGLIGAACAALGLSRAGFHRRTTAARRPPAPVRPRPTPARALAVPERQAVLDLLRQPRFVDQVIAHPPRSLLVRAGSGGAGEARGVIGAGGRRAAAVRR